MAKTTLRKASTRKAPARKSTRPAKGARASRAAKPRKGSATSTSGSGPSRAIRPGFIGHTELASAEPEATKAWCEQVLGWSFGKPVEMPWMTYHLWSFGDNMGGGIRPTRAEETPGSIPFAEFKDIRQAYEKALAAGAQPLMPPQQVPSGGWIAVVRAPGRIQFGLWAPN